MSNKRNRICKKLGTCKRRKPQKSRRPQKSRKQKNTRKKKQVTWGGNYDTDFTSTTLECTPTKSPHMYTVAVPGQPIMSGRAYKEFMENIDTNRKDI